jgi:hypothetical protein
MAASYFSENPKSSNWHTFLERRNHPFLSTLAQNGQRLAENQAG